MNTKSVTAKQLAALQAGALPVLRTATQFAGCTDSQIVEHVLTPGYVKKNWIADSWLNCIVSSFSQNFSVAPSQESRDWSGMEGGHVLWDSRSSEQLARGLAKQCGIEMKN